jgi:hypothetical protein
MTCVYVTVAMLLNADTSYEQIWCIGINIISSLNTLKYLVMITISVVHLRSFSVTKHYHFDLSTFEISILFIQGVRKDKVQFVAHWLCRVLKRNRTRRMW